MRKSSASWPTAAAAHSALAGRKDAPVSISSEREESKLRFDGNGRSGGRAAAVTRVLSRSAAPTRYLEELHDEEALPGEEEPTRFHPGVLVPVGEGRGEKRQARTGEQSAKPRPRAWRAFDRALLAAEVLSALVVAWIVGQYIFTAYIDTAPRRRVPVDSGSAAGAAAQVLPSPTPTRVIEVAPPLSGPPPTSPAKGAGGTTPATSTPTPSPTLPAVDPKLRRPTRLRIPAMFLDSPVEEVTVKLGEWEVSPLNVGHHEGTANPGEVGNVVLAAHRDVNSALFRELDRLEPGDEVFVSDSIREYRYVVTESFVVSPKETEVMEPTGDRRVTLITCTPIGLATQRLVVTAILDESWRPGR